MRTYDVGLLKEATDPYKEGFKGFDAEKLIGNRMNIVLTNADRDIAIFERERPSVATGHYFFNSRGRKAINAANVFLSEVFGDPYDVRMVIGMTPIDNRAALWMNRQLGFKNIEVMDTINGPMQFVILTRREWRNKRKL